jgi:hypothetical protein
MSDGFSLSIKSFCDKAKLKGDVVIKKLGLKLLSDLVVGTPVDTGRCRANWYVTLDNPSIDEDQMAVDPEGASTIARGTTAMEAATMGNIVYFTNNLVYAMPLEMGHSQQAPAGWCRIAVKELKAYLAEAVQEA